ncbi:cation diffusion facilitator family transporter [Paralimibaculum aggregatum]|uniref:Cation diffusion facilitator family transporter n=1 Tax=Paralimibaculum aggregatum TaxID=3036245 RepID=A0ABQ6LN92_9RHOB|nr:cation diffusion facilitator family transporter [Limibaculum sp. NKW23]GMG83799.1 cation diffusion facilitator family transporter [Limibaculum sp. NKW23]
MGAHDHFHGHAQGGGHSHAAHAGAGERRLLIAAALTGIFMLAEVVGGLLSGSLALIADAGHMLTDFAGLALAWYGLRLARRPADWRRTFGYDRFTVLVAFANGLALFAITGWIAVEAVSRLAAPAPVLAGPMLWIALAGLAVNIAAFAVLSGGERNLNMRAALLHVIGDLLGSVAAIAAALVILFTGWTAADPILSLAVAALILRSAWRVVAESGHILLEGTPEGLDPRVVAEDLAGVPGVARIGHLHLWSISEGRPMATLEATPAAPDRAEAAVRAIKDRLAERHAIHHATVEIVAAAKAGESADG